MRGNKRATKAYVAALMRWMVLDTIDTFVRALAPSGKGNDVHRFGSPLTQRAARCLPGSMQCCALGRSEALEARCGAGSGQAVR